jgi:hypothetical protein
MLKFVKIVNFDVQKDDIACVLEARSVSLEYLCVKKLLGIYQEFLNMFPTSLDEDMRQMRDPQFAGSLTVRQHNAMVYRTEQKRILIN